MGLKKLAKVIGTVAALSFSNIYAQNTNYLSKVEASASKIEKYQKLKNAGIIKGIIYNPSKQELSTLASNIFSQVKSKDTFLLKAGDLGECVSNAVKRMSSLDSFSVSIFPLPSPVAYGNQVPRYIIFGKDFPLCFENKNEYDLQAVVKHELVHVLDAYFGIPIKTTSKRGFLKEEVLIPLGEVRADYYILKEILKEGKLNNSEGFFKKNVGHYLENIYRLNSQLLRGSEYEKQVITSTLNDFSDIGFTKDSINQISVGLRQKNK